MAIAAGAVLFGVLSVMFGAALLFGGEEAQTSDAPYVGFVLWFNFLAGFFYMAAGLGLWARQRWAVLLSWLIAAATLLLLVFLAGPAAAGGDFEQRTVTALGYRLAAWLVIAGMASRWIRSRG